MTDAQPTPKGHRGLHPQDARLFLAPGQAATLRTAAGELAWLLERGYALDAALKLVGDRHTLRKRQRMALLRSVCAPQAAGARLARRVAASALRGRPVLVDGLNQIITIEVGFSGGIVLCGADGALRDLGSVHGTYRLVSETPRAIEAMGRWLARWEAGPATVLLDAPVSNTGRIAALMRRIAAGQGWDWQVELRPDVDARLKRSTAVVATSDSAILDAGVAWLNLAGEVVAAATDAPCMLRLAGEPP